MKNFLVHNEEIQKEMCGKPHLVFFDRRFVTEFIDKNIAGVNSR